MSFAPEDGKVGSLASDLPVDVAALVAEAALPLAQLLLRRRLRLQKALHRFHLLPSDLSPCLGSGSGSAAWGRRGRCDSAANQTQREEDRRGESESGQRGTG